MEAVSGHAGRVRRISESFAAANERLMARLRGVADEAAERAPAEGWSAAQIGWHVAGVTTRFAGMISGEVEAVQPLAAGFSERSWDEISASIPARAESPAFLVPPDGVGRAEAIAALEASGVAMARALGSLTAERGAGMGLDHRLVGRITVYQIGEWATAHVMRHNKQAKRVLGQG